MWYQLNTLERSEDNEIRANIQVPSTSSWFDGHFPEEPILPGLAQIGMVFDAIRKVSSKELMVSSVSRLRFKRMVRPDDRLEIIAAPLKKDADAYTFRIQIQDEPVCNGVIRFVEKNAPV